MKNYFKWPYVAYKIIIIGYMVKYDQLICVFGGIYPMPVLLNFIKFSSTT